MKAVSALMVVIGAVACGAGCASAAESPVQTVAPAHVQRGEWFKQTGCTSCHSIGVYNVWNIAASGPDLSVAVEDVPKRFGRSLEDFLHAPEGTMAMVLSTRIPLTPTERDLAIEKLQEAYRQHLLATGRVQPAASH